MADENERAQLVAEIAELQIQHMEANGRATYVGWTREEEAAHDKRIERLAFLRLRLASLDSTSADLKRCPYIERERLRKERAPLYSTVLFM